MTLMFRMRLQSRRTLRVPRTLMLRAVVSGELKLRLAATWKTTVTLSLIRLQVSTLSRRPTAEISPATATTFPFFDSSVLLKICDHRLQHLIEDSVIA